MRHLKFKSVLPSVVCLAMFLQSQHLLATDHPVTNLNDSGLGSLRQAIIDTNKGASGDSITFMAALAGTITLAQPLMPIIQSDVTLSTNGNAIVLDGSGMYSGLFFWPQPLGVSTYTLDNSAGGSFTASNTASIGGNGAGYSGGGGLGAGGGIFVGQSCSVTLQGMTFSSCLAQGGMSGQGVIAAVCDSCGGGGMNGGTGGISLAVPNTNTANGGPGGGGFACTGGSVANGLPALGGGGGGGIFNDGGSAASATYGGAGGGSDLNPGGSPIVLAGGDGGQGSSGSPGSGGVGTVGGTGTGTSGAGGGGDEFSGGNASGLGGMGGTALGQGFTGGGGGGGVGGGGGGAFKGNGGDGGFAGGGGGGGIFFLGSSDPVGVSSGNCGTGGFGGGGGGLSPNALIAENPGVGGNGGFGGGAGGGGMSGGFGGGQPSGVLNLTPGAGAGMGGAIFIMNDGSLTISNTLNISEPPSPSANSAVGGMGAATRNNGQGLGQDIFIMSGGTMNFAHTNTVTISTAIESDNGVGGGATSAGGLNMSGSGVLQLSGTNTYTGTTGVFGGVLQVYTDANLGHAGLDNTCALGFNGGVLEILQTGFSTSRQTILFVGGGTIDTDLGVTATFNTNIGSIGAGAVSLTKTGSGTLVLSSLNSYTGATQFNDGIVQISAPASLMGTSSLIFNSGTLELVTAFGTNTLSKPMTINASGGTLFTDTSVVATASGIISGSGRLTKDGPGTLILSNGSNSQNGVSFNNGIVKISSAGNLGTSGSTLLFNSGTLEITTGFFTISDPVTLNSSGGTITTDAAVIATLDQNITGAGGLTKNGVGTLILTGTNSYSPTTVNAGFLQGTTNSLQQMITINSNASLVFNQTFTGTFVGSISGDGSVVKQNTGTVNLTGSTNTYLGTTSIAAGTLQISDPTNLGSMTSLLFDGDTGGTLEFLSAFGMNTLPNSMTFNFGPNLGALLTDPSVVATASGVISGSGPLVKNGPGTLILSNASNSQHGVNFNNGIVQISSAGNLGMAGSTLTFNSGILEITSGSFTIADPVTLNASGGTITTDSGVVTTFDRNITGTGSLTKDGAGTLILTGTNHYSPTTVNMGTLQGTTNGLQQVITLNNGSPLVFDQTFTGTFVGSISGNSSVTKQDTGTVSFAGTTNIYTGTTFINGGTLQIDAQTDISGTSGITFDGGNLELLPAFGTNTLTTPITLDAGGGTLTTDSGVNATVTADITGSGNFIKAGTGTLIVTGNSNYTGTTEVQAGTLVVNGTIVPSTMTVEREGTLAGNGTVANVTIDGTISPGESIGTLTGSSYSFNGGSKYLVEITNTTSDLLVATGAPGTVTINSGANLIVDSLGATKPQVPFYTIITATGGVIENGPFNLINNTPFPFGVIYNPNDVLLVLLAKSFKCTGGNAEAVSVAYLGLTTPEPPADLSLLSIILTFQSPVQQCQSFSQMLSANLNDIALSQENVAVRIRQIYSEHLFQQSVVSCSNVCMGKSYWRIWAQPFKQWSHQQGKSNMRGYKDDAIGTAIGIDYQWERQWAISAGFSYANSEVEIIHGKTHASYDTYAGTLAGLWTNCHFFADASFSYLYNSADVHRKMKFSVAASELTATEKFKASSDPHSNELMAHLGGGYDFKFDSGEHHKMHFYPFVEADYIYLDQDGFREKGAKSLDLKIYGKSYDMLRPDGGLGFAYAGCFSRFHVLFDASASYAREFRFLGKKTKERFEKSKKKFTVAGLRPKNNLICPTASVGISSKNEMFSVILGYQGEYGAHFHENAVDAEFKFSF